MLSSLLPLLYCSCTCKSKIESYTTHCHKLNTTKKCTKRAGLRGVVYEEGGGGGTESQRLELTAQAATWEQYEREIEPPNIKIFVSENAFQAI